MLRKEKIFATLLVLIIVLMIGFIMYGIFMSKNYSNKDIENQNNTKEILETDIDDNTSTNNESEEKDNKEIEIDSKTTTNKTNNTSVTNNNQKEKTTNKDVSSKMELKKLGNLQYYLYIPSNPTKEMPLIMYLHGGTNKSANIKALLTTDGFPKYLNDDYYKNLRAYVVIPKLSNNYVGWSDITDELVKLINNIYENYKISKNKISLTGHSMGGTGTYQVQVKLPSTFACIAPMSGSIKNIEENINALSKTKIWAFIGTSDDIVDPSSTREIINTLKANGANAKITEFANAGHFDVPSLGYKNLEVINWLVNCSK